VEFRAGSTNAVNHPQSNVTGRFSGGDFFVGKESGPWTQQAPAQGADSPRSSRSVFRTHSRALPLSASNPVYSLESTILLLVILNVDQLGGDRTRFVLREA